MHIVSMILVLGGKSKRKEKHTLYRRKAKLLGNFSVTNPTRLVEGHPTNQLGEIARASNGATTPEGLELDVVDLVRVRVDLDLELHHITASGSTNETGANVFVTLLQGTDVTRVVVVI